MFKVGDRVKIVRKINGWKMEYASHVNTWTHPMDNFISGEWIVEWIGEREFGIEGSVYNFPIECAELVEDTSKHHPHHDLIIAWAKGAEIEYLSPEEGSWYVISDPMWGQDSTYRIKPANPNAERIERIERIEQEMRRLADELKELRDAGCDV